MLRDDTAKQEQEQEQEQAADGAVADALSNVAEALVDGEQVDWQALESAAPADDVPMLRALREVDSVIAAHRHIHEAESPHKRRRLPPLRPGERWNHLEILKHLGGGGFGDVYAALDTTIERNVALKLLHPGDDAEAGQLEEAKLLARVRHDNVVTVYGADRVDGRVGIWMELLEGHTLTDEIERYGPMGAAEASVVGMKVCNALAAVHRSNIVHRDVKAQNVMREPGGRVVLTDFGIGFDESLGRGAGPAGTPAYLAPELLEGGAATVQSDVYALGVLLFHLVTGSFPVRARSLAEFQRKHRDAETSHLPDLRSDLPEPFVRVVEKALARSPSRRYGSAGEFHRALSNAMARDVLGSAWSSTSRRSRRRQFARGAAAAAAVLLLAGWALWHFFAPGPELPREQVSVLLDDIDDKSGDLAFMGSFDWALRSKVQESGVLEPVAAEAARQVASRMRHEDRQGDLDDDEMRHAALRLGAPAVLSGELLPADDGWELGLWLSSALDEGQRRTVRRPVPKLTMAALVTALDGALADLEVAVREWAQPGGPLDAARLPRLEPATTSSLAALQQLSDGLRSYRDGEIEPAETKLRLAVDLDPQFATAYLHLGHSVAARGDPEGSLEHFARAFELASETATDLERLHIEGAYYAAVRQYRPAIDRYRQILDVGGDDPTVRRQLALAHLELGQMEEAVLNARLGLGRAESINQGLLVYLLAAAGHPAQALEEAQGIRDGYGESQYLVWSEALALLGLGRIEEALAKIDVLRNADSSVYRNMASWMEARILIYRGDLTQAADVLHRDRRTDAVEGSGFLEIRRRYWTARIQMIRGQRGNALSGLDNLDEPDIPAHLTGWRSVGVVRAELGDVEGARRILRRLETVDRGHPSLISEMVTSQLRAEIELASGRPRQAVELLARSGAQADVSFVRSWARAHAAVGDLEQAAFHDRQLIERRGEMLDREFAGLWVEAHVRRARCLELLGRAEDAEAHWRVARTWWRDLADRAYGAGAPADALPWLEPGP